MGVFDQAAREAGKADGTAFLHWLLTRQGATPPWAFDRWDDTRRSAPPGDPDRTDDLLVVLCHTSEPNRTAHVIVEVELEPRSKTFQRMGHYALTLSNEVSADGAAVQPVMGVLLVLTGRLPEAGLRLEVEGCGAFVGVKPEVVNLCDENAVATLTDIAAGRLGFIVLPFVPLMAGGGELALIEEWKRVALREPDAAKRALYRDLALVFAELAKELVNWQGGLEGFEMQESTVVQGWINRGVQQEAVAARRAWLLRLLQNRFQTPVPEPIRLAIEGTNDVATLDRWFDAATSAPSLAEFRAAMRQAP